MKKNPATQKAGLQADGEIVSIARTVREASSGIYSSASNRASSKTAPSQSSAAKGNSAKAPAKSTSTKMVGTHNKPLDQISEQVLGLATWVLGSRSSALTFMSNSHSMLGGITPFEALQTAQGRENVERLLWNIEYSLPA